VPAGCLEDPNRAQDVDGRVVDRPLDRDAHVGLRSQVEHRLWTDVVEEVVERLANVSHVQRRAGRDVLLF
jgi:hypothetical protein